MDLTPASARPAADLIPRSRRSRLGANPWKRIDLTTERGRLVYDKATRYLTNMVDRDNPLTIGDAISLAQLRVRAGELAENPASDDNLLVRIERIIELRMSRLGLAPSRPRRQPFRLFARK